MQINSIFDEQLDRFDVSPHANAMKCVVPSAFVSLIDSNGTEPKSAVL